MSDFINTVDIVNDDVLMDSLIDRSISGSFNDDRITSTKNYAFYGCTNLESVSFPNATSISYSAFQGSGLKAITPETFPSVTAIHSMYRSGVFRENAALESVDWPSLTHIGDGEAFYNCKSLRSVNLPNCATPDGGSIFTNCTALKDVNLPVATKLGANIFDNCTSLETITLPLTTTVTGNFQGCTSLRLVDLPSCTTVGGQSGFINCTSLKTLILRSETMCTLNLYNNGQFMYLAFRETGIANGSGYVYVPSALIDSYKTDTNWGRNSSQFRFRPLEDYTIDGTITGEIREHCESLSLNVAELTFTDENNYTLTPTGNFGVLDRLSWESSNTTVVRVNKDGVVTPIGDGTATITVRFGEYTATCAVTVNAGLERAEINILDGVGFNAGYFSSSGSVTQSNSCVYTDKFDISPYVGKSIEVQLKDAYNKEYCRIRYSDANDVNAGSIINASTADYGSVITSTVPTKATYAAISVNMSFNFSSIEIFCDGKLIGYVDYMP